MNLNEYYNSAGFDGNYKFSYYYVTNVKNEVLKYTDIINDLSSSPLDHNYLEPETYNHAITQTENPIYAKTLKMWNSAGYTQQNIGNLADLMCHKNKNMQDLFKNLGDRLNLNNPQGKITIQPPGSCFPLHIDGFSQIYANKYNVHPESVQRYCIFLTKWEIGHFFGVGQCTIDNWNIGDVFTWPSLMPHATANASVSNKISLSIVGIL